MELEYVEGNAFAIFSQVAMHNYNCYNYFHVCILDMAIYDPVIHSGELQLSSQLEATSNPELEPNNAGDITPISDSGLQPTAFILNTNSSNDNANTSTTQQLDIVHDSTVSDTTPANISETRDSIVSARNSSEMSTQSEFNTSSLSNDVYSHAEPGITCLFV